MCWEVLFNLGILFCLDNYSGVLPIWFGQLFGESIFQSALL
ncbi:hypothetical protein SLEP1_g51813 [Rubroshorea leprosula]|uniref:Uncharacterized protein n=1 Tax=Rubroshorea leprosula TaxID=152421 RepID=A0AAV5M842_9ROSI|nr:hypothetical protein SLEP1_g51813 [Rubroshorea leprosula]